MDEKTAEELAPLKVLAPLPGVTEAQVNLALKKLASYWYKKYHDEIDQLKEQVELQRDTITKLKRELGEKHESS